MQPVLRTLSLVLVAAWVPAHAAHDVVVGASVHRSELRTAVQSHLANQVAQVQREDALAGRHLNAAERLELRQQVRRQWSESASASPPRAAESQSAERFVPAPALAATATPIADAQPTRALPDTMRNQRP